MRSQMRLSIALHHSRTSAQRHQQRQRACECHHPRPVHLAKLNGVHEPLWPRLHRHAFRAAPARSRCAGRRAPCQLPFNLLRENGGDRHRLLCPPRSRAPQEGQIQFSFRWLSSHRPFTRSAHNLFGARFVSRTNMQVKEGQMRGTLWAWG
ncbi:hypothetical protein TRVL_07742 [Trypanosoma vivax]|nr:hypothetical protein TRVL_07742 [Trypanosoma vivax]